jgi:hypothetical protein
MAYSRKPQSLASAICFFFVLSLTSCPARGGLQDAINRALDGFESLEYARDFVAPIAGNDIPTYPFGSVSVANNSTELFSDGPQVLYAPDSGNLTAVVPAAVIDSGMLHSLQSPTYVKLYSIAGVSLDSRQLHGTWSLPASTALAWGVTGPLTAVPAMDALTITQNQITWRTTAVFGGSTGLYGEPLQSKIVAAVVNLGPVLPRGLTLQALEQSIFPDPLLNVVDYYNHRGVITYTVPFTLGIVPEPSTMGELTCAIGLGLVLARRPARRATAGASRIG